MFRKKKPKARFFSLHPGVHTLHPITKAAELDRDWVGKERDDYRERLGKCPFSKVLQGEQHHPNSIAVSYTHLRAHET